MANRIPRRQRLLRPSQSARPFPSKEGRQLLSIILPARNEEENLAPAFEELTAVLSDLPCRYEVLVIDNDSDDGTAAVAAELCERDRRWKYVKFSRNFGVEASIAAGLRFARGDAALVLFSDLQDPPDLIPEFFRRWREGHDVVYGVLRRRAGDPLWRRGAARLGYWLIGKLAEVPITPNATDFRLLSRRAIDALNRLDERHRYLRGLAHWIGFRRCAVPYDRRPRTAGRSKAPLSCMLSVFANALTGFSVRPVQVFSLSGAGLLVISVCLTIAWLAGAEPWGMTGLHLLLLGNLTALLVGLGIVGEYVARGYMESKRRPLYLVESTINLDDRQIEHCPVGTGDAEHASL
jgi:dolichol-phosphate mannosyltransferase